MQVKRQVMHERRICLCKGSNWFVQYDCTFVCRHCQPKCPHYTAVYKKYDDLYRSGARQFPFLFLQNNNNHLFSFFFCFSFPFFASHVSQWSQSMIERLWYGCTTQQQQQQLVINICSFSSLFWQHNWKSSWSLAAHQWYEHMFDAANPFIYIYYSLLLLLYSFCIKTKLKGRATIMITTGRLK